MRRTTLSALQPIDLNRSLDDSRASFGARQPGLRKSFGGPAPSSSLAAAPAASKNAPSQSRASSALGASYGPEPRRSSLMGSRPGMNGNGLADPRPLTSKSWMNENVEKLAKFLMDNDYPQRITSKILQSPTGKDFQSILTFLLRMLDPTFSLSTGPGKMEDEVHNVFKSLRYPFQISKTALTAVGAQQSWPAVMGAMMWLLELLEYDRMVGFAEEEAEEEPRAGEPAFFFNFVRVAYERFLAEDDEKIEEIKASVAASFGEQHSVIERDIAGRRAENDRLKAELAALKAQASKLPTARNTKSDLEREVENLRDRVADAEKYVNDIAAKMEEKKREAAARQRDLDSCNSSLAKVSSAVRSQELSLTDVENIGKKKASLKEQAARLGAEKKHVDEEAFVLDRQLAGSIDSLRVRVGEYNQLSGKLQITPSSAKYSSGVDFTLQLDEGFLSSVGPSGAILVPSEFLSSLDESMYGGNNNASSAAALTSGTGASTATTSALLSNDMKLVIKAGLREMKGRFAKSAADSSRSLADHSDALARLTDAAKDTARRNETLSRQLREREGAVEAHRAELANGLAGTEQRISRMESDITAARSELALALAAARELSPEVLHGMSRQVEAHLATLARQRAATSSIVGRLMGLVAAHKEHVAEKLTGLAGRVAGQNEAMRNAPPAGAAPAPEPLPAMEASSSRLNSSFRDLVAARSSVAPGAFRSSVYPQVSRASSARFSLLPAPNLAPLGVPVPTPSGSDFNASTGRFGARPSRESLTMMRPGSLMELMEAESGATQQQHPAE